MKTVIHTAEGAIRGMSGLVRFVGLKGRNGTFVRMVFPRGENEKTLAEEMFSSSIVEAGLKSVGKIKTEAVRGNAKVIIGTVSD